MTVPTQKNSHEFENKGVGITLPFDSIDAPGAYICNWSGHLLRVPDDSIKPGRSPLMSITGTCPLVVTKISCDHFVQVSKARLVAAECDVPVNF